MIFAVYPFTSELVLTNLPQMSVLVEQADEQLNFIEENALKTERDMEKANTELSQTIYHMIQTRRRKWICFCIALSIVVIIAAVIALHFTVGLGGRH